MYPTFTLQVEEPTHKDAIILKKIGYHCHGSSVPTSTIASTANDNQEKIKIKIGDSKNLFELAVEKDDHYQIINSEKYDLFKNIYIDLNNDLVSKIYSYEEMDSEKCEQYLINEMNKNVDSSKSGNILIINNENPTFIKCLDNQIFYIQK